MAWNLAEAVSYYRSLGAPGDQSSLIGFLREIQQENGGSIPKFMLTEAAEAFRIKEALLLALVKRIPSLRLADAHVLELCAGPNCGKAADLAAWAEVLKGEGGSLTLKYVPCMRMCGKGPNIRFDGTLYHQATVELLRELVGKAEN